MPDNPNLTALKAKLSAADFKLAQNAFVPKGTLVHRALSGDTSIAKMGISDAVVAKLSPAARKLTKDDLVKAWQNQTTPAMAKVSVTDLNIIKSAFGSQIGKGSPLAADIYCCCCPCCCATAIVRPNVEVA